MDFVEELNEMISLLERGIKDILGKRKIIWIKEEGIKEWDIISHLKNENINQDILEKQKNIWIMEEGSQKEVCEI